MRLTTRLYYFFFGADFSSGLRTAVSILLPAALGAQFGQFDLGLTMATGAVCVSVPDAPGPASHRRNGQLAALALVFAVALLTGYVAPVRWLLGLEVALLSFGLSMFLVWGARAGAVGTAGLLALVLNWVRPYRAAQQALGESIHALAGYLNAKADFYRTRTDLADDYRRLVARQVAVSDTQEAVRAVLFRSRQVVNESTSTGRRLVLTFIDVVDLYERATATFLDYGALRRDFADSGALDEVARLLRAQAAALDRLGAAIQANRALSGPPPDFGPALEALKTHLDALGAQEEGPSVWPLKKTLVTLRDFSRRLADISRYFDAAGGPGAAPAEPGRAAQHLQFIARDAWKAGAYWQSFTLKSAVFRHSLRVLAASVVAFGVADLLWQGAHSYWILLTATVLLKPGFSLTRQRNEQRVLGTLGGGLLGLAVLAAISSNDVRFAVLVVFAIVAYSFQRLNYVVFVVFLTAYLILMYGLLKFAYLDVLQERVIDTLIGCGIAFVCSYFLFPRWEAAGLPELMAAVLRANQAYLHQVAARLAAPAGPAPTAYRLARKTAYVATANLAAAFQRMLSEPKRTQHQPTAVYEFVVLNYTLAAGAAALAAAD
ncbi:FUSC family protein, partial [Hymenobacter coccineus]